MKETETVVNTKRKFQAGAYYVCRYRTPSLVYIEAGM